MRLHGTLSLIDRVAARGPEPTTTCGTYVLHKAFGGNVRSSPITPGSRCRTPRSSPAPPTFNTATREHALPAPYKAAADGTPSPTDKGVRRCRGQRAHTR